MKRLSKILLTMAMVCAVLAASGCVAYPAHRGAVYPPPPRAPAPGYHQEYRGHDLRYDANLGVYVILDMPNHYFYHDNYYRYHRGRWYYSHDLKEHWRTYDERRLPPGLARKYHHDKDERDRNRDHH